MKKIIVISYDRWNYDKYIVDKLNQLGHNATHIKLTDYKHKNILSRATNFFSKLFFNKNLKKNKRQQFIIEQLKNKPTQNHILIINPELFEYKYLIEIKKFTKKFTAYLYDSTDYKNIGEESLRLFDNVFSFDNADVKKHGFQKLTNYNYLDSQYLSKSQKIYDVVYVGSYDNRIKDLILLNDFFRKNNLNFKCLILVSNKKLKELKKNNSYSFIEFITISLSNMQLLECYSKANVIVDLVRKNQQGLSFRIFEAMALKKKIITNNLEVKHYPFYKYGNIITTADELNINFMVNPYIELPTSIYNEYTLDAWVRKVFDIG